MLKDFVSGVLKGFRSLLLEIKVEKICQPVALKTVNRKAFNKSFTV
jgi:hypothetical protein